MNDAIILNREPMLIVHLGADELTFDMHYESHLAGAIRHYARLSDAVAQCRFIKSVAVYDDGHRSHDFLGHRFEKFVVNVKN